MDNNHKIFRKAEGDAKTNSAQFSRPYNNVLMIIFKENDL